MKKIICVGKGASGKDFLKRKLLERGLKQSISYTTRPPRSTETNGIDYHFISEETFKKMIENNEFREYNIFGEQKWYYGTTIKEFKEATLFVMTPSGINALTESERKDCQIIFIDIPEDIRLERLKSRNDADTPERRIKTDEEDFKDFKTFDIKIVDPFFGESIIEELSMFIDLT